jgi:hypothetical protein
MAKRIGREGTTMKQMVFRIAAALGTIAALALAGGAHFKVN